MRMPVSILRPCITTWSKLLGIAMDFTGRESTTQRYQHIGQVSLPDCDVTLRYTVHNSHRIEPVDLPDFNCAIYSRCSKVMLSYPALSIGNRRTRIRPSVTVISAPPSNASWCCSTITRRCRFTLAGCIFRKRKRRDSHVGQEFHTTVNSSAWTDSSANQAAYANAWRMSSGSR
jgi:hypothetical protein